MKAITKNLESTPCNYETAKFLKTKGFYIDKSDSLKFYHDETDLRKWDRIMRVGCCPSSPSFNYQKIDIYQAPTHDIIFKWFRLEFGIHISINPTHTDNKWGYEIVVLCEDPYKGWYNEVKKYTFDSPEEAETEAITYSLLHLL